MPSQLDANSSTVGASSIATNIVSSDPAASTLARAQEFAVELAGRGSEIDSLRRLPTDIVDRMRRDGFFRMTMPLEWGGSELDPWSQVQVIEALYKGNPSVGWSTAIGSDGGFWSAWLEPGVAREVWSSPDAVTAGQFKSRQPPTVHRVPGGFRATGRYSFASGIDHADVIVGGFQSTLDDGSSELRVMIFDPADVTIIDTWHTTGLRGTGSNDFTVEDVFVPVEKTFTMSPLPTSYRERPLYADAHGFTLKAIGGPLGLAGAAIDEAIGYFTGGQSSGRESESTQIAVAEAVGSYKAHRLFVQDVLEREWERAQRGRPAGPADLAELTLARTSSWVMARAVVTTMAELVGARTVYEGSKLEGLRRDMITGSHHVGSARKAMAFPGRILLGLDNGPGYVTR